MTRRQISARAFDPEHKRLMLAYRNARGGDKERAFKVLRGFVTECLSGRDAPSDEMHKGAAK